MASTGSHAEPISSLGGTIKVQSWETMLHDVYMGPPSRTKIIFYQMKDDVFLLLSNKLVEKGYMCCQVASPESALTLLQDPLNQVVLVLHVQGESIHVSAQTLLRLMQSHGLSDSVLIMAILPSLSNISDSLFSRLLSAGISRLLSEEDCEEKFLQQLRLAEMNELKLNRILQFSSALKKAIENSHDAIQITRDSTTIYVNKSFVDLTGYQTHECLGKPADDIMGLHDNGTKGNILARESYEGHFVARRKSGSCSKQYIKLLPVRHPAGHISHHVTIQRMLTTHEYGGGNKLSSSSSVSIDSAQTQQQQASIRPLAHRFSLARLPPVSETPILRAVGVLDVARESPICPIEIKESLDKCIEILCSAELFTPLLPSKQTKGLIAGLLDTGSGRSHRSGSTTSTGDYKGPSTPLYSHNHGFNVPTSQAVQECLSSVYTWDFNIIHLESASHFQPLYLVGMKIFTEFQVCETLNISDSILASWLKLMEKNYRHSNAYHNSTHAADVLQGTAYLIRSLQEETCSLEPTEIASLLITAAIHDLDHPGRTNPFLVNSRNELALLYNDRTCLENHHVAKSFSLSLQHKDHNIYQNLDNSTYQSLRSSVIDLVFATDISKHFEHLSKFENMLTKDDSYLLSCDNRLLIQRLLVKCADISNACRPIELCKEWAGRVAEEYFSQTEEEKKRGLHVVFPDFDRLTCKLPVTQVKFIDYFVSGLFHSWNSFSAIPRLMENLTSNYAQWKEQYESPHSSDEGEAESTEASN